MVTGLHALGDSVCTTNPTLGRRLSMALAGAVDLTEVLEAHAESTACHASASAHGGVAIVPPMVPSGCWDRAVALLLGLCTMSR